MRASAFYWPYKDGNIAREQGARPRLLWHIGECKQGGGACCFTTGRQMARLEAYGFSGGLASCTAMGLFVDLNGSD